jgi:hypothetical protein
MLLLLSLVWPCRQSRAAHRTGDNSATTWCSDKNTPHVVQEDFYDLFVYLMHPHYSKEMLGCFCCKTFFLVEAMSKEKSAVSVARQDKFISLGPEMRVHLLLLGAGLQKRPLSRTKLRSTNAGIQTHHHCVIKSAV